MVCLILVQHRLFIQKQNKFMLRIQTTMLTANFSMGYTDVNTTSNPNDYI